MYPSDFIKTNSCRKNQICITIFALYCKVYGAILRQTSVEAELDLKDRDTENESGSELFSVIKYESNPYGYSPCNNFENQIKITVNQVTWPRGISIFSYGAHANLIVIEKYCSQRHLLAVIMSLKMTYATLPTSADFSEFLH